MRIGVIGGSGRIGSNVVNRLRHAGHEIVAASPRTGVDGLTGEGLTESLAGPEIVVDVVNAPTFGDKAVLESSETPGRHLLAAEATSPPIPCVGVQWGPA